MNVTISFDDVRPHRLQSWQCVERDTPVCHFRSSIQGAASGRPLRSLRSYARPLRSVLYALYALLYARHRWRAAPHASASHNFPKNAKGQVALALANRTSNRESRFVSE
jgi:hypothetical protein